MTAKILLPPTPVPAALPPALSPGPTPQRSGSADPAKIAKAAHDFEAMAIGQLLQPMFDTVDTAHSAFGGGDGEAAWRPMLVQEMAKQIEASGGLGLAQPVYEAMLRMQEAKSK
jgi:flagellar protein FlgJ